MNTHAPQPDPRRLYRPAAFFSLDFVLTWGPLWLIVIGQRLSWFEQGTGLLVFAGVSATLSAILFVHLTGNRSFVRDFWIRAVDPSRIGAVWWLVILGLQPVINLVSISLSLLIGGAAGQWQLSEEFLSSPILFLLWILVFGPIPEELGWRGYGLDALRSRMNLLQASLLLGVIWAVWHLPLVFVQGSFQQELLAHPGAFITYFAAFFPSSIIMSWIYYRTNRSTLSAILFHFSGNAAGELFSIGPEARMIAVLLGLLFAAAVVWRERPMFSQKEFRLTLDSIPAQRDFFGF